MAEASASGSSPSRCLFSAIIAATAAGPARSSRTRTGTAASPACRAASCRRWPITITCVMPGRGCPLPPLAACVASACAAALSTTRGSKRPLRGDGGRQFSQVAQARPRVERMRRQPGERHHRDSGGISDCGHYPASLSASRPAMRSNSRFASRISS